MNIVLGELEIQKEEGSLSSNNRTVILLFLFCLIIYTFTFHLRALVS